MATRATMGESTEADAVLAELVEEITNKLQSGESVELSAYERDHPEQMEQLRKLLPAIEVLAELKDSTGTQTTAVQPNGPDSHLQPGVLGDYRIIREAGRGGMGVVYEAQQISLSRKVALKVLPFAAVLDNRQLQRFKSEAQAAAPTSPFKHRPCLSVGCERGVHYYAMQYIDGHPLSSMIHELRQLSGLEPSEPGLRAGAVCEATSSLASGRYSQTNRGPSLVLPRRPRWTQIRPRAHWACRRRGVRPRTSSTLRSVADLGVQAAEGARACPRAGRRASRHQAVEHAAGYARPLVDHRFRPGPLSDGWHPSR